MPHATKRKKEALIFKAIEFAAKAHAGQYRKGTRIPYIVHPLGVARVLLELGCAESLAIAGVLHDTLEDTDTKLEHIEREFGKVVAQIVLGCTEPHHKEEMWEIRKQHTIEFLKTASMDVLLVTCADKFDNIRAIRHDCKSIGDEVWLKFHRGKDKQEWYYQSLADVFMSRIAGEPSATLFPMLKVEVDKVFGRKK